MKRRPVTNIVRPRELWARLRCWPGQWHNPSLCPGLGLVGYTTHACTAHLADDIAAKKRPMDEENHAAPRPA